MSANAGASRAWFRTTLAVSALLLTVAAVVVRYSLPARSRPEDILATVDGHPITAAAFAREMARRGQNGAEHFASAEQRRALLDDMIRLEVLAANGEKLGYSRDPEVQRNLKQVLAGKFQREQLEPKLHDVAISDSEVRQFYAGHVSEFTKPEAARAAVIFFAVPSTATAEERAAITKRAEAALAEARAQAEKPGFGALAVKHSDDQATRYLGGDTGWLVKGQEDSRWEPEVMDAVFALAQPGDLSPIVSTASGVYLLKLTERRPAVVRPLAEVETSVRQRLTVEKRNRLGREFYDDAKRNVSIHINEEHLASLTAPEPAAVDGEKRPPPLPRGR
jgi:parvulin-like peptidyl-prolyl isomerase